MKTQTRTSASGLSQFLGVAILLGVLFIGGARYLGAPLAFLSNLAKLAQTQIDKLSPPLLPAPGTIRDGTGYARPEVQEQMEAHPAQEPQSAPAQPAIDTNSLPANSAGQPVISERQAQQLNQAVELAHQEGQRAADQAAADYEAQRRANEAAAPVKMTKEEAERTYTNGRDLCSIPRADPNTCKRGIPEATPLNSQP